MSEPFLAEIMLFAGDFAPRGWAFCNGQLPRIAQNTALFSLLGTTYGGDGRTTFGLPNLRGRVAMHGGQDTGPGLTPRRLGQVGGSTSVTLSEAQMPRHDHRFDDNARNAAATEATPKGHVPAQIVGGETPYVDGSSAVQMASVPAQAKGGGQAHTNLMPSLGLNYVIAMQGLYPSRN